MLMSIFWFATPWRKRYYFSSKRCSLPTSPRGVTLKMKVACSLITFVHTPLLLRSQYRHLHRRGNLKSHAACPAVCCWRLGRGLREALVNFWVVIPSCFLSDQKISNDTGDMSVSKYRYVDISVHLVSPKCEGDLSFAGNNMLTKM